MAYTKNYPVWNSGTCCGAADPGPVTPITVGALNNYEQALFDAHNMEAATAGTFQQTSKVVGDANVRYSQLADGTLQWGDGTNPPDTSLFRAGPSLLLTPSTFAVVNGGGTSEVLLSADPGQVARVTFRTTGLLRWAIDKDGSAEGGANAGSNFMIQRYDDAGNFVSNVLNIVRSTGVVSITSPGVANGAVVSVDGAQPLTNKTIAGSGPTPTTSILTHRVTGDTQVRWNVDAAGTMSWSPGAGAMDTTFGRTAAGQLGTNADIHSNRSLSTVAAFSANVGADTNNRWQVTTSGTMTWGAGSGATDCTFGRSSAGVLRAVGTAIQVTQTNGSFGAFQVLVVGADTGLRWGVRADGTHEWGTGSSSADVQFLRNGAGNLDLRAVSGSAALNLKASAGGSNVTLGFFSGSAATAQRWLLGKNSAAEGGANAGSDFAISSYTDTGTLIGVPLTITRSTGQVTLANDFRVNGSVGFYNTAPVAKPTVTGSRGGNVALASLLTALASQGLITDSSTA